MGEHLYGVEVARRLARGLVIDWDLRAVGHLVVGEERGKEIEAGKEGR